MSTTAGTLVQVPLAVLPIWFSIATSFLAALALVTQPQGKGEVINNNKDVGCILFFIIIHLPMFTSFYRMFSFISIIQSYIQVFIYCIVVVFG